ncbi:MAG: DNA translocase FtsK [Chloroflexi bacterium]|nr:DNA translocase FtsK [Chloroflexota bacterium]
MIRSSTASNVTAEQAVRRQEPGLISWPKLVLAAFAALLAAAAIAYWKRDTVLYWFEYTREEVLSALGLGLISVVVWLLVLRVLARWRPIWRATGWASWLTNLRLWISTVGFLAFSLAVMAFFRPAEGILGQFSLEGSVSLSGWIGETIIGPVFWAGVLRAFALFVLTILVAAPTRSGQFLQNSGSNVSRGVFTAYLFTMLTARLFKLRLRRLLLRNSKRPSTRTYFGGHFDDDPTVPTEELVAITQAPVKPGDVKEDMDVLERWSRDLKARVASLKSETDFGNDEDEADEEPQEASEEIEMEAAVPEVATTSAKFNKYWSEIQAAAEAAQDRPEAEIEEDEDFEDEDIDLDDSLEEDFDEEDTIPTKAEQLELPGTRLTAMPLTDNMASKWAKPPKELLHDAQVKGISEEQMVDTAETIRTTLGDYGVEVEVGQIRPGPTVTMYGLNPGWIRKYKQAAVQDKHGNPVLDKSGKSVKERVETKMRVRVDSILAREKDLALALKTPSIRIETPVLGKSLVGIEVPNPKPDLVTLRAGMESEEFKKLRQKAPLPVVLGKGSGGEVAVADLSRMPHLLVAGATGSGKSVCLNTIVSSLIIEKSPSELRLLLIDPKRVELTPYNGIPHLLQPVVVDSDQVVGLLKGMIREMLNRYRAFEEQGVRNIDTYNKKARARMPYLVVVIDELADLMMTAAFDVEHSLCRLAQLGRATGIHLVVATQRPSVDVVTGLIKANFPSRISFGVTSQIDSRTILDSAGAEKLLGRGDMLYAPLDASRPSRIQGAFLSDSEVEDLVKFWKSASWPHVPQLDLSSPSNEVLGADDEDDDNDGDELFDKAVDMARSQKKLSTSLLQRRLRIGYPRAARLMDELEDKGVVGPSDGSKSRDVMIGVG